MDIIEMARELGKAIQQDERYIRYQLAIEESEANEELQGLIGEFNLKRAALSHILNDDSTDKSDLVLLDTQVKALYNQIMELPAMKRFNEQKADFDALINSVNTIILKSAEGEDPDNIDPHACTGDCSCCGGCH